MNFLNTVYFYSSTETFTVIYCRPGIH